MKKVLTSARPLGFAAFIMLVVWVPGNGQGQAVYMDINTGDGANDGLSGGVAYGTVKNSIVWRNTSTSNSGVKMDNYGTGCMFNHSCTTPAAGGTGNIALDPLFVNSALENYKLLNISPCINQGNNAYLPYWLLTGYDLGSGLRVKNGIVDMGVYEY